MSKRLIIYCGKEGFLSVSELVKRTEADIAKWSKKQPLKFRHAMSGSYRDFIMDPANKNKLSFKDKQILNLYKKKK